MLNTYSMNAEAEGYWKLLKNVRSEVKLRLITLLSQSVIDETANHRANSTDDTKDFIARFSGAWHGDDTAENIITVIHEGRQCKNPISFD